MTAPTRFDVCGPLPAGVTVLEASAGTGKTFTIASLAARYVAEGTPLARLLLVTFTRSATGELRERVRERLVTAERGLQHAVSGIPPPSGDDVLGLLVQASPDEVRRRRRRLADALADFDAATISTTHGFCQHVLSGLGIGGDVETDVTFVDDATDLIEEVIDDLYLRKFWRGAKPEFTRDEALAIGRIAVRNPDAALEPAGAAPETPYAMRRRLATAVREEVESRKRAMKLMTFDDLLTRLASALSDPVRGDAACSRMRDRYWVAMVDEFQDTDTIQWDIMRRAFGNGSSTLVLIGDPKQAIYAFRGADVYAYLAAARTAATRATLGVNWRSDQALIDAYDALMGGMALGHEDIEYVTVQAAAGHQESRLRGVPNGPPLRMRLVHRDDGHVQVGKDGWATKPSSTQHIADDLAADVVDVLSSSGEILARHPDGSVAGISTLGPGDVAVLVSTHRQAGAIHDALHSVGVPAVISGVGSVFATRSAREWFALLRALERPSSSTRVRAAALTPFVGWPAERVATADDEEWEHVFLLVHRWTEVLRRRGVAALLESITHSEALPRRVLERDDGERTITDLRHVGELLHAEAVSERLGVAALTAWLGRRLTEAVEETVAEDRLRRLETDAEAVQVLTIFASKGLEFPIVYCPYLWDPGWIFEDEPPVFHDRARGDRRTVNVGGGWSPGFDEHRTLQLAEERGEELRLAYVALTRARHQAVVWWASSATSRKSPLARLLFPPDGGGPPPPELKTTPDEDEVIDRLTIIEAAAPGSISLERTTGGNGRRWGTARRPAARLDVRRFGRALDGRWRRTSYTGITEFVHEADVDSEPEEAGIVDEQMVPGEPAITESDVDASEEATLRAVSLPLAVMPGGTRIGSLIHSVLEHVDFTASDLTGALTEALDAELAWSHIDVGPPESIVAGLGSAVETPLGPLVDDVRLRDIGAADRLDELTFELPLVGGDTPAADLTLVAIAGMLDAHIGPDDVLAGYASRLREPGLTQHLRGYLSGSVDAVLRLRSGDHPRFVVVDYKTNWLSGDEPPSAFSYRPTALAAAMQRAHYPLQALLYAVALHRFLRWRLPDYDPNANLAGVLYLFLRGMTGAGVPRVAGQPCGVFAWRPPAGLVSALSDLFDRGTAPA